MRRGYGIEWDDRRRQTADKRFDRFRDLMEVSYLMGESGFGRWATAAVVAWRLLAGGSEAWRSAVSGDAGGDPEVMVVGCV